MDWLFRIRGLITRFIAASFSFVTSVRTSLFINQVVADFF